METIIALFFLMLMVIVWGFVFVMQKLGFMDKFSERHFERMEERLREIEREIRRNCK